MSVSSSPPHKPDSTWNLEAFGIAGDDSESSDGDDLHSLQLTSEDDHRHHMNAGVSLHPITAVDDDTSVAGNVSSRSMHFDQSQKQDLAALRAIEEQQGQHQHDDLAPIASLGIELRPTPIFSLSEHQPLHLHSQAAVSSSSSSRFRQQMLPAPSPSLQTRSLGPDDFLAPTSRYEDGGSSSTPRSSSGATTPSGDEWNTAMEVEEAEQLSQHTTELLKHLEQCSTAREILALPFPLFVFGTLRMHLNNNYLMGLPLRRESAVYSGSHFQRDHALALSLSGRQRRDQDGQCKYNWWSPAGVRSMICDGLKIIPLHGAPDGHGSGSDISDVSAAMGEVFAYDPENFAKVIGPVDDLENFTAGANGNSYQNCTYVRTLMWADMLPRSMRTHLTLDLGKRRSWTARAFDEGCAELCGMRVPVWVYSSTFANMTVARHTVPGQVLLWAPHTVPQSEVAWGHNGVAATRDYLTRH